MASRDRFAASTLIKTALVLLMVILALGSAFSYRHMAAAVHVQPVPPYSLIDPPFSLTCVGLAKPREARWVREIDFATRIPEDVVMINGTRTARGLIGTHGYWGIATAHGISGMRGFPIVWQLREHQTYSAYTPYVRFYPRNPEGMVIDSYSSYTPLGNGYLFAVLPVELINATTARLGSTFPSRFMVVGGWGRSTL